MWHSTKRYSSIFDLGPQMPKICTCTKLPITRLVWQIVFRCLGLLGGFQGWPIQWNHAKCCGADPCCHGNEIWARHGDLVAYRLVVVKVFVARDLVSQVKASCCPVMCLLVARSLVIST